MNMYKNIKTLAKLYIISACEQSIAGNRSVKEILQLYHSMSQHSSATANRYKYTNVT